MTRWDQQFQAIAEGTRSMTIRKWLNVKCDSEGDAHHST